MSVGRKLKDIRMQKKLTQQEVSKSTGISTTALSNYELDIRTPDAFVIKTLAEYYNVSSDYILNINQKSTVDKNYVLNKVDYLLNELEDLKKHLL